MARIRTIKPEFWADEIVGLLTREARLLFAASFNLADDEGLLRWTPAYIKASVFMYDNDLGIDQVSKIMTELADSELLFPYIGGIAQQRLALVVNFRRHQRINRPQPGKLPAPSLQNTMVCRMYAKRDRWTCQLCGDPIPERRHRNESFNLSIDHVKPTSRGGNDYPSNVRAAHLGCNKGRRDQPDEEFTVPRSMSGLAEALNDSVNEAVNYTHTAVVTDRGEDGNPAWSESTDSEFRSLNDSVNGSLPHSLREGKGREGKGKEGKGTTSLRLASDAANPTRIDVEQACTLLADLIEANGSKRPVVTKQWRDAARLMLDKDHIPPADILAAIRWSQADEFWRSNILSMPKLREKYDTLRLQAQRQSQSALAPTGTGGYQGPYRAPSNSDYAQQGGF